MGSVGKKIESGFKGVLGLQKPDTSGLSPFQRTPEQIEAEKRLLGQLTSQAMGGANPASDMANRQAMALAASQSRNASNPFLGIKAAQQAQQEGQAAAKLGAQQQLSDLLTGQRASALQAAQGQLQAASDTQARRSGFLGNLAGSGATLFSGKTSDEQMKASKKAVMDSGGKIDEFLKSIDPYTFEYKNDELGKKQMGVMAQDLEKSEVGSAAVREVNGTKVVDPAHLTMPILAAQSDMFKKIKALEEKVKKRA